MNRYRNGKKLVGRCPESNRGLLHPKQEFYHLTTAPFVEIVDRNFMRLLKREEARVQ
jgi:hypothetical protein